MTIAQRVYLDAFLAPLAGYLDRADVTDLYINRPGELWLETPAGTERHDVPALDDASLWRLARQIAASSDQGINRKLAALSKAWILASSLENSIGFVSYSSHPAAKQRSRSPPMA